MKIGEAKKGLRVEAAVRGTDERIIMQIRNRRLPVAGEMAFYCGAVGHVHVTNEHDVAAAIHCREKEEAYYREHGECAPVAMHPDWLSEGYDASVLRVTADRLPEIDAAKTLLTSLGYSVGGPV